MNLSGMLYNLAASPYPIASGPPRPSKGKVKGKVKGVAAMLKAIHAQEDREEALRKAALVVEKLQG